MKMNNFKTKFLLCATALAITVSSACIAYTTNSKKSAPKAASNDTSNYEQLLPTIKTLSEQCALSLAKKIEPNLDLQVKECIPIYNVTNDIVGYSASYYKDNTPYGYASFDFTTDELVTDFVINKNADSMYDTLTESFAESNKNIEETDCTEKLYSTSGIDYAVSANNNGSEIFYYGAETYNSSNFEDILDHYEQNYIDYYDNVEYEDNFYYGLEKDQDDFIVEGKISDWFKKWINKLLGKSDNPQIEPTPYPNHSEVFKEVDKVIGNIAEPVFLPQYSKEKSLISQKTIMTTTNRYACGLVALTAICQQEDILTNGNIQDTFNKLWDITGTQNNIYKTATYYEKYTVECSGTSVFKMAEGMTKYGASVNATITPKMDPRPEFSFFKNAVDNKRPSVLCYQIANEGGHGVSIFGYTNSTIGSQSFDYIIAADGWFDDAPRYVLYKPSLFESTTGIEYTINK